MIDHILFTAVLLATVYWIAALACASAFGRTLRARSGFCPPVTVLKPLRGDDGHLYRNLRSFCEQDYPTFQVIFGVQDRCDPAVAVVDRLVREFPDRDLALIVDERLVGTNLKVSNLASLVAHARHDTFVIVDSDMRVGPGYVRAAVAPLEDPAVGLVTCLYHGVAPRGVVSKVGAMFINEWFFPAALVGIRLQPLRHAFGATITCGRDTLLSIGGFEAVADKLADDYMLGWLVSSRGLRVALSPYVVDNVVVEHDVWTLLSRELRWMRTFRVVRPLSYACSVVTYGIPLSLLWLVADGLNYVALVGLAVHLVLRCGGRVMLYRALRRPVPWSTTCLVPIRDVVSFILWGVSFLGRNVRWNDQHFRVGAQGQLERRATAVGNARRERSRAPAPTAQP